MDIATQIAIVRAGLWNQDADPLQGEPVLPGSTKLRMVNWPRVRPALEILASKSWWTAPQEMAFYLGEAVSPQELILENGGELQVFATMIQQVKSVCENPIRVLEAEHPIPLTGRTNQRAMSLRQRIWRR